MSATLPRPTEPLPLASAVRAGTVLARQGETSPMLWRVRTGALWASLVQPDGRELALDVLGPGDLVGEPDGAPSACTVRSLRVTRVHPVGADDAVDALAARARRATVLAAELAWSDVPQRLGARLRDLAERFGRPEREGLAIGLRLSQEQLALLCGSTRETVNRALRGLDAAGEVRRVGPGRYVVRPPASGPDGTEPTPRRLDFPRRA